jgi:hypothetical protein
LDYITLVITSIIHFGSSLINPVNQDVTYNNISNNFSLFTFTTIPVERSCFNASPTTLNLDCVLASTSQATSKERQRTKSLNRFTIISAPIRFASHRNCSRKGPNPLITVQSRASIALSRTRQSKQQQLCLTDRLYPD